jgi:hypothetical protein
MLTINGMTSATREAITAIYECNLCLQCDLTKASYFVSMPAIIANTQAGSVSLISNNYAKKLARESADIFSLAQPIISLQATATNIITS